MIQLSPVIYHPNLTPAIAITVVMGFAIQHYKFTKASHNELMENLGHIAVEILHNKTQSDLNNQTINHKPYLSSIEVYQKLLQLECKMPRRGLWNQVSQMVESNENVWMRKTSHSNT